MTVAIMWQPRFGHYSLGQVDNLGLAFAPLIQLDQSWIHHTHYLIDDGFDEWIKNLPLSQVHPRWRDDYVTHVSATARRDEAGRRVQLTFRLTGSDRPRVLTEIRIDRPLAEALGVSPPHDFTEKPYDDAWFNKRTIRWVGQIALPRDKDVQIVLPVMNPNAGKGRISYVYCYGDNSEDWSDINGIKLN
jgi:hypothetical protein